MECHCEMECVKNQQFVNDVEAGGFPSTYHASDIYGCPVCDKRIATGFSREGYVPGPDGEAPPNSITYAHHPEQLTEFAEQFAGQ